MKLDWTSGIADVGGLPIAWEQAGPQRGEPLMLVMGLGGQLIHWPEALCADLVARGFRVIRFDNRDAGLSADADAHVQINLPRDFVRSRFGWQPTASYTLRDMARDTVGLMDALEIDRAHLCGVSMGGMISQIVAGAHPSRVRSLTSIMSSTNHPRLPAARLDVLWHMSGIQRMPTTRDGVIRRATNILRRIGSPAYPTPIEVRREVVGRAYDRAYRPRAVARQTHAVLATGSFEALLPQIRVPTQIVHGLADPLLRPSHGRRSARLIRGARLELIDGMGHDFALPLMPRWAALVSETAGRA